MQFAVPALQILHFCMGLPILIVFLNIFIYICRQGDRQHISDIRGISLVIGVAHIALWSFWLSSIAFVKLANLSFAVFAGLLTILSAILSLIWVMILAGIICDAAEISPIFCIIYRQHSDRPLKKPKKFAPQRIIFVFGAIGPVSGNVIYYLGRASFNA